MKHTTLGREIVISPDTLVTVDSLSGIASFALLIDGEIAIPMVFDVKTLEKISSEKKLTTKLIGIVGTDPIQNASGDKLVNGMDRKDQEQKENTLIRELLDEMSPEVK